MDQSVRFKELSRELVESLASWFQPKDGTRLHTIVDDEHGHYELLQTGWRDGEYVHHCVVHLAVEGGKVVIYRNETDIDIDDRLSEEGVDPEMIVISFKSPGDRPAVAA